jgi:hypothetical protein
MKRYYNSATHEWYTEGQSLTRKIDNGVFSGIPSEQRLTEWGYEEWVEPEPTPEQLLQRAKSAKIAELEAYDASDAVNSFSVNGKVMWLDAQTRQQLRISLDAMQQAGRETVTKWFDGEQYTYPIDVWYYMLSLVEVYAADALNVTESHKAAINALDDIEDVEAYDYTVGYPDKLSF